MHGKMNKRSIRVVLTVIGPVLAVVLFLGLFFKPNRRLPTGFKAPIVATGANHGVILASDGSLWTWGEDAFGWHELGLGSNVRTQAWPRRVGSDTNWVRVAAGGSTTLALKSDGTMWAWGENLYGQLGDGTTAREQPAPVRSVPGNDWKEVATGGPHSVALKRDGTLWSWGNNWAGQLGDGGTNFSRAPVRVGSSSNWTRIWAGAIQNVGQQSDGSLWFWGWDYTRSSRGSSIAVPTRVSADTNWASVGMGDYMVFAIRSDGTLWAWGRLAQIYTGATNGTLQAWSQPAQLHAGAAKANQDSAPMRVGTDSDWRACASFAQACPVFMKRDGSVWCLDGSDQRDRRGVALVTAVLAGLVTNNQLTCVADGGTLGCDPAFGVVKSLQIAYRLGDTDQTNTFAENAHLSLGGTGQKLTIVRGVYGDPELLRDSGRPAMAFPAYPPAKLRRIPLPANILAFGGGRHQSGAALSADGTVWTWGESLTHGPAIPALQLGAGLLNRFGAQVHWGDPRQVINKEPVRLEISAEKPALSTNKP
jgi:hypothetical protein